MLRQLNISIHFNEYDLNINRAAAQYEGIQFNMSQITHIQNPNNIGMGRN